MESSAAELRILRLLPLHLRGDGFEAGESVRVAVSSDDQEEVQKVRASERGSFELLFENVRTGRGVAELAVRAVGSRGSSAAFTLNQIQRAANAGPS